MSSAEDEELLQLALKELVPDGPKHFPDDFVTDSRCSEKFMELEVPGTHLRLASSSQVVVTSSKGTFRYEAKNPPQAKYIIYAYQVGQRKINIPKDNLSVFKAVKNYERHLDHIERRSFEFFLAQTFDEARSNRLTTEILRRLGLRKLGQRELPRGVDEAIVGSQVNGFPTDPSLWFALAKWAKENDQLYGSERRMTYSIGRYLSNKWELSSKQKVWATTILDKAKKLGFQL